MTRLLQGSLLLLASLTAVFGASPARTAMAMPATGAAASHRAANPLVGVWHRANSCDALVRALTKAGLHSFVRETLVGAGYFADASQISASQPCHGARNVKHSHFFTASGGFGSYDEKGAQVDDGDYKIIAPHTLVFPSHAREFGHKVTVHYRIGNGKLTFSVVVPRRCAGKCRGATAWAISAFYRGAPFTRGK
jgi:hypothetical protein